VVNDSNTIRSPKDSRKLAPLILLFLGAAAVVSAACGTSNSDATLRMSSGGTGGTGGTGGACGGGGGGGGASGTGAAGGAGGVGSSGGIYYQLY